MIVIVVVFFVLIGLGFFSPLSTWHYFFYSTALLAVAFYDVYIALDEHPTDSIPCF